MTIKGERLDIAGIRFWTKTPGEIAAVLKGTGGTTILLAHDPRRLRKPRRWTCSWCCRAIRTAGRWWCPRSDAIAGRKFPVLAGYATQGTRRSS